LTRTNERRERGRVEEHSGTEFIQSKRGGEREGERERERERKHLSSLQWNVVTP
jgi:hypothetical protein